MPQSLSKILIHFVFSTKQRYPFLQNEEMRLEMQAYLAGIFKERDCPSLIVNGTADHMHALVNLSKKFALMEVIKEAKRGSSVWIKNKGGMLSKFHWQDGYGAFSVSQSQVQHVRQYIVSQQEHHKKISFQEEFHELLRRHEIDYDEKYLWD
jgi:REP element-mobilizing transposase RayT